MTESLHSLDKRLTSVEEWKEHMQSIELPTIREAIKTEIPAHYTKRISESEGKTMLQIGNMIDEKLEKKFGWMPRLLEGLVQAVLIAIALYLMGLAG